MTKRIDKDAMIDSKGSAITQGLFLETSYGNTENVVYTLKSRDHKYKGRLIPSIKRLYLEMEDITEYEFAYEYFLDWDHWQRIRNNKLIAKHLEGWADELKIKQACAELRNLQQQSMDGKTAATQQLLKVIKGEDRGPGRPPKAEVERVAAMEARIHDEFAEDLKRLGR